MKYEIFGPFSITTTKGYIRDMDMCKFWEKYYAADSNSCFGGIGCYVFTLKQGNKYIPWYVGKTTRKFRYEIFTDHKIEKYNEVLRKNKNIPAIFIIVAKSPKGDFMKYRKSDDKEIDFLLLC